MSLRSTAIYPPSSEVLPRMEAPTETQESQSGVFYRSARPPLP